MEDKDEKITINPRRIREYMNKCKIENKTNECREHLKSLGVEFNE